MAQKYDTDKLERHIVSTPDVLRGKPRIKGTRILLSLILSYLAEGQDLKEIRQEFPDLTGEQIAACREYASRTLQNSEPRLRLPNK